MVLQVSVSTDLEVEYCVEEQYCAASVVPVAFCVSIGELKTSQQNLSALSFSIPRR